MPTDPDYPDIQLPGKNRVIPPNEGMSTCPMCHKHWLVTPFDDCLLPECRCFGEDTSRNNPHRPCESCGLNHALTCPKMNVEVKDD